MDFTTTKIDFTNSNPKRVEVIARLSNNKTPVVYAKIEPTQQQIVSLFKDYLSNGTTIKSVTLKADYVNDPIPKTKKKFANGGCVPCSRKMEDGGLLGEVDGMLPSSNSMSVIQPMAKGGKTQGYDNRQDESLGSDGSVSDDEFRINKLKSKIDFWKKGTQNGNIAEEYRKELKDDYGIDYAKGGKTYTKKEIDSFANDVNAYVYYTFNYYSPNHFEAFGSKDSSMYDHIKSKFSGYYNRFGANAFFNQFWVELDGGNQLKLATWIKENYEDSSMDRVTSTNQEFADNINQWVMFSFNYPHSSELDFMDAWSGSMKEHLGEKFTWYYDMVGSTGVMNYFYVNLDGGNQRLLSEWVLKNYPASNYAKGGRTQNEYKVEVLIDEEIDLGTNVFANSEDEAMDKAEELIRERNSKYEDSIIDIVDVVKINAKGGSTYSDGGSADSIGASVEVQVVDMLLENTGQHFLDSGGDKGRQWQRNQDKIFQDEPRVDYEVWNGEISDTVSAYHYLTEILDTDEYSYEVNQYLRSDKDEEGDACHWIEDCKERLENSEEFSEIEWIGKMENTYNYENNLSQVFLSHIFKNPYTDEVYCLFQLHGGADVRGGYTTTRCFKLEGYLTGQVDVYGSVDGVQVTNSYNGYSLTTDDGEEVKATEDSEIGLDFQIYDDLPYEDGGRIPKQKMSYGGKAFKTPEAFVENLMDFSPYGALSQMFIIDAIGKYIDYTNSYTEEDIANDRGIIDAQTWVNTGKDIDGYMKSFYAHDGSYPNKRVKDNIGLIKDIMKNRGNDFFNRLYILEAINRQSKGVAEATDEQIQAFEDKGNTMVNMWGWRNTARNIQERIKEYNESKKEDGGYVGIDNSYESGDKGKYRYVLYDILDDGERVPLLDFYSDKENLHTDMAQSPVSVRESQEIVRDDNFFQVDKNITRSYFEDEPYYLKKGGKAKSDPQIVRYYFEDEPYEYGIGGFVLGSLAGGYLGYKVGRSRPQKKGFETEKKIARKVKQGVKDVTKKEKPAKAYAGGGSIENRNGEEYVIGIENLNGVVKNLQSKNNKVETLIDRKDIEIKEVSPKGFITNNGLVGWKYIDDRHTEKEGVMIFYDDFEKYFYFKLTDEERKNNPYGFDAEKRADIEDSFRDTEEEGYLFNNGGEIKASDLEEWDNKLDNGEDIVVIDNKGLDYMYQGSAHEKDAVAVMDSFTRLRGKHPETTYQMMPLSEIKEIKIETYSKGGSMASGGYVVSVFKNRDWEDVWNGDDEDEAYDMFTEIRSQNIKKNDVGLFSDDGEGYESIEVYDAMEDLEQDPDDDYKDGGEIEQNYEVGDIVELSESGWDNESYHDFFNGKDNVLLLITDVYKSTSEHQGYDEFIGQALYSTKRVDDNEEVPFDLYDWELESDSTYSKGGSTYEGGGKVSNKESSQYARNKEPFNGSNLSGKIMPNKAYVVLSYGYYPLYVYKYNKWYENKEKYSVSTTKQQGQSRPTGSTIKKTTKQLKKLAGL